jgi:hypothetical protein
MLVQVGSDMSDASSHKLSATLGQTPHKLVALVALTCCLEYRDARNATVLYPLWATNWVWLANGWWMYYVCFGIAVGGSVDLCQE